MEVKRGKPFDRIFFGDAHGVLELEAVARSFLFIGSGRFSLHVDKEIVEKLKYAARMNFKNFLDIADKVSSRMFFEYKGLVYIGGRLAIPGSSIKGAVRSRLELMFHVFDDVVPACFIVQGHLMKRPPKKGESGWRHHKIWKDVVFEYRDTCSATGVDYFEDISVCPVCDIFGTSGLSSRVFFDDFYASDNSVVRMVLDHNDKIEAVKENTVFTGSISLDVNEEELGLLSIGMNLLSGKPILIGYSKYRVRKREDGSAIILGRVAFSPKRLSLTRYSKYGEKVLEGNELIDFLKKCEKEALDKWGKWLKIVDEVSILEKINREDKV